MNRNFKTTGIVIRKTDFNETDRIVTILTEADGKIDCVAKGARSIKSKFLGRLELFNQVLITCFKGRELYCAKEAELISGCMIEKDPEKHKIVFYVAELTNRLIKSGQQVDGVYPLLLNTLEYLKTSDKYEIILHTYLIKLLTLTGFLSPWNHCAKCGTALTQDEQIWLSTADSNVICAKCTNSADEEVEVPHVKLVNYMQNYPLSDALKVQAGESEHQFVWKWLQGVTDNLLGSPMKSEKFLHAA